MPPVPDTIPDSHSSLSDLNRPGSRGRGRAEGFEEGAGAAAERAEDVRGAQRTSLQPLSSLQP
eukprot:5142739-Pleurochrysis_carterae.AAC.1